ncbi:unnamed protein product [Symbiodinium natans]|uniref:Uncharacterized protein n=1 Tax=Symbiodinium natans TaxID=878477 RepID=A0A812IFJ4_9DINO|nr:unnamed protein product [Symbiodinium natans]
MAAMQRGAAPKRRAAQRRAARVRDKGGAGKAQDSQDTTQAKENQEMNVQPAERRGFSGMTSSQ